MCVKNEKERLSLVSDKDELEEEVGALKRELVKAEELRMRMESFSHTLERTIQQTTSENEEVKEQIDHLVQVILVIFFFLIYKHFPKIDIC